MSYSTIITFITLLALNQVSADGFLENIRKGLAEAETSVVKEAHDSKNALDTAIGQLKHTTDVHMGEKLTRLQSLYDRASDAVDRAPEHCRSGAKQNLMVLKSAKVGSFITCSQLLTAAKDIGGIVGATAGIGFDIFDSFRDVTSGFAGCLSSWWPWKIVECFYDRITTTYDDIKRTMADIKNYASTISVYAHNASVLIDACWEGHPAESEAEVLSVMEPVHQCANQQIPHQLYRL